jgi:hypothetical protein
MHPDLVRPRRIGDARSPREVEELFVDNPNFRISRPELKALSRQSKWVSFED